MKNYMIEWITFNAFIDTDLYIIDALKDSYKINWYIIKSGNDTFEYMQEINRMQENDNLHITLLECGERLRKPECMKSYKKLLCQIKRNKNAIVYTSLAGAPYFIPMYALRMNMKKTVLAIHNVHVPKGGSGYWFFLFYNRFALWRFQNFQVFSKSQYDYLKELVPHKRIAYTPFMLKDYGVSKIVRTVQDITFLNFGNIRAYKRIDVLIQAAQIAYEKTNRKFRVIIAGKCDDWERYEKLIKYPELFELHIGRVENADIPDLFHETDYFVAPYQDIAQSGSSVIAINYGKPIIASRLPAFEEYIEDRKTGFLIKPADVNDLTRVMISILENHDAMYANMCEQLVVSRDNNFSDDAIVRRYKEYFDEVFSQ